MVVEWLSVGELILDRDGQLWTPYKTGHHWLGPIEPAEVPRHLERARDELLDLWRDAFDDRAEQLASYRFSVQPRSC